MYKAIQLHAEESAAASEELAGQAEVLKEQVQMFNLKNNSNNSNSYATQKNVNHELESLNIEYKKVNKISLERE